jgi:RNA polymerase II subunit A C-terminal domain phosphatase SSU72
VCILSQVASFGVGNSVKLPGQSLQTPNRYEFDLVTYQEIYNDLKDKDEKFYASNGILDMMARDIKVKPGPQKWQNRRPSEVGYFDVVVTFELRVMEIVVADLQSKNGNHPCVVINMEVKDSAAEAQIAAPHALELCTLISECDDWEEDIEEILETFSSKTGRSMSYDICYQ